LIETANNLTYKFITDIEANDIMIEEEITIMHKQIEKYNILRHLKTFYQTDESLRELIHKNIYQYINNKYIDYQHVNHKNKIKFNIGIFLGGEMYIYGKIFNHMFDNKIYITDTKSIHLDGKLNDNQLNKSIHLLVDYNNKTFLSNIINYKQNNCNKQIDWLISNISKKGLGLNICEQILKILPKHLILISCKKISMEKDLTYLQKSYNLDHQIILSTNYDIFISFMILL
jgi:tRNA/tmRNA/rRNA uracil-C5-methylase (TrmA/RlmC/RlmD family)